MGDSKLKEKDYKEAITHYRTSLSILNAMFENEACDLSTNEEKATHLTDTVSIPSYLNLALCYLQLEDWENAVHYSSCVIKLNPFSTKALCRRCRAYIQLGDLKSCLKDIEKLSVLIPYSDELSLLKEMYGKALKKKKEAKKRNSVKFQDKPVYASECTSVQRIFDGICQNNNLIKFVFEYTIQKPVRFTLLCTSGIKYLIFDIPFNVALKSVHMFIISPSRLILDMVSSTFTNMNTLCRYL